MSNIHYFQRYSGKENTVTNNLLLLISRIYAYSPKVCSKLFSELLDNIDGIVIGLDIKQQIAGQSSVPDGSIRQKGLCIQIEAKVDASHFEDQLIRHLTSFENGNQNILLLVTKSELSVDDFENYRKSIREKREDVTFCATTYENICSSIKGLFKDHEVEMKEVADDFVEYCNDVKLFDQSKTLMRVPPCGASIHLNKKYGIYFQPDDRGYSGHSFIGAYAKKSIQVIWKIKSVFDIELAENGVLTKKLIEGEKCDEFDESIKNIIHDAKVDCGYGINTGHRFFCGKPVLTDYRKTSPGGIMGACFIDLKAVVSNFSNVNLIADELKQKTWE